jgi:putative sterol carrier protein
MDSAEIYEDANAALFGLVSPPQPKKEAAGGDEAGGSGMSVKDVFDKMPDAFNPDAAKGVDVIFQYSISGTDGGDWTVTVKDGTCEVTPGKAEKPTCTLKMADNDFLDMISGRLDPMKAFTSGKLKIDGDVMKSQLIGKLFSL